MSTTGASLDCSASSTKTATVVCDLDGDCILVLPCSRGITRFRVSSQVLCLASPVFRAMLNMKSGFKEGKSLATRDPTSQPIEVVIADDDPPALTVALRIIHLQFERVPEDLTEEQLFLLAIVCDKYDLRRVLQIWLEKWIKPITNIANITTPRIAMTVEKFHLHKLLFITWVVGEKELFKSVSRQLILSSTIDPKNNRLVDNEEEYNDYIPSLVIGEIEGHRQQIIESIIDCVHVLVDQYHTTPSKISNETPKCKNENDQCDSFHLGYLLRRFMGLKIYPGGSETLLDSITDIHNRLKDNLDYPAHTVFEHEVKSICVCYSQTVYRDNVARCKTCLGLKHVTVVNHAIACSPMPKFQQDLKAIIDKVQGLDYSDLVRPGGDENSPPVEKTWDSLEYV